jgi:hypothetical protein
MLWLWKAEVFAFPDYGPAAERYRNLDFDGICGDVRVEVSEATPPLLCHDLCLVLRY